LCHEFAGHGEAVRYVAFGGGPPCVAVQPVAESRGHMGVGDMSRDGTDDPAGRLANRSDPATIVTGASQLDRRITRQVRAPLGAARSLRFSRSAGSADHSPGPRRVFPAPDSPKGRGLPIVALSGASIGNRRPSSWMCRRVLAARSDNQMSPASRSRSARSWVGPLVGAWSWRGHPTSSPSRSLRSFSPGTTVEAVRHQAAAAFRSAAPHADGAGGALPPTEHQVLAVQQVGLRWNGVLLGHLLVV
jgi:hypothetical protein